MTAATPNRIERLRAAYDAARNANSHLNMMLEHLFPVGSSVSWCRGINRIQTGKVVLNGSYGNLYAVNNSTGKEVKIGAFEILQGGEE